MNMKKYEFTQEKAFYGTQVRELRRIRAIRDFGRIKAGTLGGFVEDESNLSHGGDCWIFQDAKVMDDVKVSDNAFVLGEAVIGGETLIYENAVVMGKGQIAGKHKLHGNARINLEEGGYAFGALEAFDEAEISGAVHLNANIKMHGKAKIADGATISGGSCELYGSALVYHDVHVSGDCKIYDRAVISGGIVEDSKVYGNACIRNAFVKNSSILGTVQLLEGEWVEDICIEKQSDICLVVNPTARQMYSDINPSAYFEGSREQRITFYRNSENTLLVRPRMHELNMSKAMPLDAFKSKIRELVSKYEKDSEKIVTACLMASDYAERYFALHKKGGE